MVHNSARYDNQQDNRYRAITPAGKGGYRESSLTTQDKSKPSYELPDGRSPLADWHQSGLQVAQSTIDTSAKEFGIGERPDLGKIALHGRDSSFHETTRQTLGFELPRNPNSSVTHASISAIWMGPCEWMLVMPRDQVNQLLPDLGQALQDSHTLLVDVGDRWHTLSITGSPCTEILCRGSSIDPHSCLARAGDCAQTLLAQVPVVIHRPHEGLTFDIHVDRSFTEFLWHWLYNAGSDFAVSEIDFDRAGEMPALTETSRSQVT